LISDILNINSAFPHPSLAQNHFINSPLELNLVKIPALNNSWRSKELSLAELQENNHLNSVQGVGAEPAVVQVECAVLAAGVPHCEVLVAAAGEVPAAGLGCAELAVGAGCEPPAGELVDEVVGVPVGEVLDEVVGELADGAAGQADVDLVDLVEAPGGELAAVDPGVFEASRLVGFPEVWHPVDVLQVWHLAGVPVA